MHIHLISYRSAHSCGPAACKPPPSSKENHNESHTLHPPHRLAPRSLARDRRLSLRAPPPRRSSRKTAAPNPALRPHPANHLLRLVPSLERIPWLRSLAQPTRPHLAA